MYTRNNNGPCRRASSCSKIPRAKYSREEFELLHIVRQRSSSSELHVNIRARRSRGNNVGRPFRFSACSRRWFEADEKEKRKKGGRVYGPDIPLGERGASGIGKPWERKNPQESHPTRWDRPISRASHKTRLSSQSDAARTSFRYGWGSARISLSSPLLCSVGTIFLPPLSASNPPGPRSRSREIHRRGSIRAIDREWRKRIVRVPRLESRTCLIERKRKEKRREGKRREEGKKEERDAWVGNDTTANRGEGVD